MAQRLLRALSPFRRRSAAQKAQEAKEEEERKAQLLKDKEDLEAGGPFSRARTDEERKLQAARRKEHEVARAQLFAGREEAPIKANGIHEGEGRNGEESRTVGSSPSRARGVGPPGKFRDGGPRENGALRQENGTGRFRFENGDAERAQMKESPGNFSPVSPLTAAASSSSSSPSLQGVPMNGTSSPLSDRASPPQGGKPKPSEGSFSSPLSGNPLLSTLSELSKNSVQPTSTAQDAGETKRPLARPLNISFMGSYNRERAESDELKEGARAASPRPRGGADPDVQKELVKTPAREEVKQTSTQVKQHTAEVKQTSLEVKIPEPVEEPEGPTAASPFRLTTSPIYMPPEPKVRRPLPPREEHEDEIPWAKDSMMRRGGWASMIMDESTYNLPRIAVRVSSPDTGAGGGAVSPRFASPGVSPRYPNGSRSPRHAAPTRAVRGLKTPEKQPPKTRSPGSFSAPLVRTEPPGGRSPKQGFMRGTASSKVKTANAKEGGRIRTSSTPRKKILPPVEAKRDDAFAGDKLLDFGASFSPAERGSELFLRKAKQPVSGGRAFGAGDRHNRLHRSASFPAVGVTPSEMAELAALKAQLSAALHIPSPSAARRKDPPPESQAAIPETLLKSPLKSPLKGPQKSLLVKTKSVGGVPEVDLSGGVEEPPAVPADVPLAAEAAFSAPLKSPKSPLKALSGGAVAQPTKSPAEKPRTASPRRSSSPLRKPVASPKAASPKGPVPTKDAPSPTSARSTSGQTGSPSPSPKSPSVKKPPPAPRNKPVLEVDVPARPSLVTSLLASPGRGSPRSSPSSLHSPASSPSRSPLRARRASSPSGASSLMSPTAASLNKAIPGSPQARSPSPSRLSRSQSVGGDEKTPSPRMSAVRSNSLPVNLDRLPGLGKTRRASSPTPGVRAGTQGGSEKRVGSPGRAKLKPAVPKREVTKRELGTRRLSDVSSGSSEELVDLGEPTSLLPDDLAPSEEGSQSVSELVSSQGGSGEVPAEEALSDKAADKDADIISDGKDDVRSNWKADVSKDGAKLVAEAEGKVAVPEAVDEAGQEAANDTPTREIEQIGSGGEGNGEVIKAVREDDQESKKGGVQQMVASVNATSAKSNEAATFAFAKHADVIKVQEVETETQVEFGAGEFPSAASRGLILEDDSLEMLPGAPLVAANRVTNPEGGAASAGTPSVHGGGETKHGSLSEPSAEVQRKQVVSISEKERRRAEVANLLAALQEREEIDYIARLVRRAQREKAQLSRPARPEDDPPSVTSSLDSLGSAGAHFEKGGEPDGESVQKAGEVHRTSAEKAPEAPRKSSEEGTKVSTAEKFDDISPPEAEGPAGLAGWSKILGASEGGETAVWVDAGARVLEPPEEKATDAVLQAVETVVSSKGVPEEPERRVVQSRAEVGVVQGEETAVSVSKMEVAPMAGVRDRGLESSSPTVDAKEPPRRKESATISMPEKPARGAAEGPETGLWDTHPSPTSPLDFLDEMQDTPGPVAKPTSHEKSRFRKAPRPDLRNPVVYVETALAHAGLTAPEPHPLPEWFSQTEVLNPALFQELERQVDADLLPSGGHRKGATWRLSLDSTALRDAYSRPHTPRKEGYPDRRMLFDRMDEVLGELLAPHRGPPLGKRRLRPLRRGPRGPELVAAVVAKCTEKPPPGPGGDPGFDACSPQGVEELLQKCLPQAQRKWDNFEVEEAEVGVEVEVGILDDLIGEAVQGFIAMEQQRGGRRRVHPVAS